MESIVRDRNKRIFKLKIKSRLLLHVYSLDLPTLRKESSFIYLLNFK